jgi:transcriptional regulator with XRE-family HTH domain
VLGLTQEELAEKTNLSTNYVARIELGLNIPSLSTTIKLARALEMEASDFIAGKEAKWVNEMQGLAFILRLLPDEEAEYLIKQFYVMAEHSKKLIKR